MWKCKLSWILATVLGSGQEAAARQANRSVGRLVGRPAGARWQAGRSVGRWVNGWVTLPGPSQSALAQTQRLAIPQSGGRASLSGPSFCPYYSAVAMHRFPDPAFAHTTERWARIALRTQRLPILQRDGRASLSGQPCFERLVLSFCCCILSRQTEVVEPSIFIQACNASRSLRSTRLPAGRACSRPLAPRQQRRSLCPR